MGAFGEKLQAELQFNAVHNYDWDLNVDHQEDDANELEFTLFLFPFYFLGFPP